MNEQDTSNFLCTIAKTIKRSFETPVILVTNKDYADDVCRMLVELRSILSTGSKPERLTDLFARCHLGWLNAVTEVNSIRQQLPDKPQEIFYKAIEFTIQAVQSRLRYFRNLFENDKKNLSNNEITVLQAELEIVEEMEKSAAAQLAENQRCLQHLSDTAEFVSAMDIEMEELLNWLDRIHDHLAIDFTNMLNLKSSGFLIKLTGTLNDTVESAVKTDDNDEESVKLGQNVNFSTTHELEIMKVADKVKALDERIERLQDGSSAAVMALQHKKLYLLERLRSLENKKASLLKLQPADDGRTSNVDTEVVTNKVHIFNHKLPSHHRHMLVKDLTQLWITVIHQQEFKQKSVISILSVSDIKENFIDYLGKYSIDKYGRKIYERSGDNQLYQANETNDLVPVNDTENHVYFYDDCGRYYLDENNHRIYHAHESASEYLLHPQGWMYKYKEIVENVPYYFDRLGRYYTDENNQRIYKECESCHEYFHDGFGNLLRTQSRMDDEFKECPIEPMGTEDSLYLKETVGKALKECMAKIVVCQPADPIIYLAGLLEQYRENMERQKRHTCEEIGLMEERRCAIEKEQWQKEAAQVLDSELYAKDEEESTVSGTEYTTDSYQSPEPSNNSKSA